MEYPRCLLALSGLACWTLVQGTALAAQPVSHSLNDVIQAKAALLVDAQSGQILYQRNINAPYPPASTVKLMTALLVWERTGLNGAVHVQVEDTLVEPSHIPLRPGEVVAVKDLTYALLIGSDNDSAMALSRHVGGSPEKFAALMNARARSLGCTHTLFKNPHGLPIAGQYTSASDLLKIFEAVLAVPQLRQICTLRQLVLTTQVGTQRIRNHNRLLGAYAGMGPAKTGWTVASRHTYAASATRNGRELHLVILNSVDKWTDARALFDYGFSTPSPHPAEPKTRTILANADSHAGP
ncbi:MAG: D-alanyl-D-alanine carboxypeptidase [Methylacidiphilales bacterium]|nr:D-alanyl-D-alanine carboxypeptidase [Candidatus Methylacidiphilales bacterium]